MNHQDRIIISGACPTSVKEAFYHALAEYEKDAGPLEANLPSQTEAIFVTFHELHDLEHLHSMWYGGMVATINFEGWEFEIGAYGEIHADLFKVDPETLETELLERIVDNHNGEKFLSAMRGRIPNDQVLLDIRNVDYNGLRLEVHNGNWWACSPTSPSGEVQDDLDLDLDSNLFNAIFDAIWGMNEFLMEVEW